MLGSDICRAAGNILCECRGAGDGDDQRMKKPAHRPALGSKREISFGSSPPTPMHQAQPDEA